PAPKEGAMGQPFIPALALRRPHGTTEEETEERTRPLPSSRFMLDTIVHQLPLVWPIRQAAIQASGVTVPSRHATLDPTLVPQGLVQYSRTRARGSRFTEVGGRFRNAAPRSQLIVLYPCRGPIRLWGVVRRGEGVGAWEMRGAANTRRHQGNETGKEMHLTENSP